MSNMNNSGTTEISNLPLSPQLQQQDITIQENVNIKISNDSNQDQLQNQNQMQNSEKQNDQSIQQQSYNQLVSGIQQASASGALGLPSRDIPQSTNSILTCFFSINPTKGN